VNTPLAGGRPGNGSKPIGVILTNGFLAHALVPLFIFDKQHVIRFSKTVLVYDGTLKAILQGILSPEELLDAQSFFQNNWFPGAERKVAQVMPGAISKKRMRGSLPCLDRF